MIAVQLNLPPNYQLPPFFACATADETAVALETASRLVPIATEILSKQTNERDVLQRQDILDDAIRRCAAWFGNEQLEREVAEKHAALEEKTHLSQRLENSNTNVMELRAQIIALEERARHAEVSGRAAAVVETDARVARECKAIETRAERTETDLRTRVSEVCADRDDLKQKLAKMQTDNERLCAENERLRTPSGRGEAGEADVASVASSLGYRVIDTSKCKDKVQYGDLLLTDTTTDDDIDDATFLSSGNTHCGLRLAIEVKNRARVSSADIAAFEAKVRTGVEAGTLSGGLFVSLRAAIPSQANSVRQTLLEDTPGNQRTVPMAYIGVERHSPSGTSVTSEQLRLIMQVHSDLCTQLDAARKCDSAIDHVTIRRVREHFQECATHTCHMFDEFARLSKILDSARKSLDAMRQRVALIYRSSRRTNVAVPWLHASAAPLPFDRGMDHAIRLLTEGRLNWSSVTNKDAVINAFGGREQAGAVVSEELARIKKEQDVNDYEAYCQDDNDVEHPSAKRARDDSSV